MSHPSRVRGLKFNNVDNLELEDDVAPFAGAWIEIIKGVIIGINS